MAAVATKSSQAVMSSLLGNENYVIGNSPDVLTSIYEEWVNLAVLQRSLTADIEEYCHGLVEEKPNFNLRTVIKSEIAARSLQSLLPELKGKDALVEDLALLVEMYACLFDLDEIGLRLQVLDRAMCPRFHTDKLGCRLVSTYLGEGTEWLSNHELDRSKLGSGNMGLSDEESGLFTRAAAIQQVCKGDVVLLKGDGWYGNEGLGAVHRSPLVASGSKRIVVTLDFA